MVIKQTDTVQWSLSNNILNFVFFLTVIVLMIQIYNQIYYREAAVDDEDVAEVVHVHQQVPEARDPDPPHPVALRGDEEAGEDQNEELPEQEEGARNEEGEDNLHDVENQDEAAVAEEPPLPRRATQRELLGNMIDTLGVLRDIMLQSAEVDRVLINYLRADARARNLDID